MLGSTTNLPLTTSSAKHLPGEPIAGNGKLLRENAYLRRI